MTPRSEKTHHVVDLLHVDAFQWECVALLFRDPVALPKQTQVMSRSRIFQENNGTTVKLQGPTLLILLAGGLRLCIPSGRTPFS